MMVKTQQSAQSESTLIQRRNTVKAQGRCTVMHQDKNEEQKSRFVEDAGKNQHMERVRPWVPPAQSVVMSSSEDYIMTV